MQRKIIYYPSINIPSQWLKWAVLYFDKVSSIIPKDLYSQKILRSKDKKYEIMKILSEEGEFEPTYPEYLLMEIETHTFIEDFKKRVNTEVFNSNINDHWKERHQFRLHQHKILYKVYEFLKDMGLAEEDERDNAWYFVERRTGYLYMSLLAKYLADVSTDYAVLGTNFRSHENTLFASSSKQDGFFTFDIKFENILPVPRKEVSIKDILKLKRKRRDELLHFRKTIDSIAEKIQKAEDEQEMKHIIVSSKEEIEREVSTLIKVMREKKIEIILGTFKSLLDIKSPTLLTALVLSHTKLPKEYQIPILGVSAIVHIRSYIVDKIHSKNSRLRESPFAYLYYVKKEGIIPDQNAI